MQFRILGSLAVERDGRSLKLSGPKQRAILAMLVLRAGQPCTVAEIVREVWAEGPPRHVESSLYVHVSALRRALLDVRGGAASLIVATRPGYALNVDPEAVDANRFIALAEEGQEQLESGDCGRAREILRRALALWRGRALADVRGGPFLDGARARLEELRLAAAEGQVTAELKLGRPYAVIPQLEELVLTHPYHERLRVQLMTALYRSGRQADALAEYGRARARLVGDLGIEPGPELQALHGAILRREASTVSPAT